MDGYLHQAQRLEIQGISQTTKEYVDSTRKHFPGRQNPDIPRPTTCKQQSAFVGSKCLYGEITGCRERRGRGQKGRIWNARQGPGQGGYAMLVCWNFILQAVRKDTFRFAFYKGCSGTIMRMNQRDPSLQQQTWFANRYSTLQKKTQRPELML